MLLLVAGPLCAVSGLMHPQLPNHSAMTAQGSQPTYNTTRKRPPFGGRFSVFLGVVLHLRPFRFQRQPEAVAHHQNHQCERDAG